MKIRTNDQVVVIAGKYKGTKGRVSQVFPKTNKVIVEGVNEKKRHIKPSQANPEGRIVTVFAPLDLSNVAILDPKTQKPSRIGYKVDEDGKKVRIARKSGNEIK